MNPFIRATVDEYRVAAAIYDECTPPLAEDDPLLDCIRRRVPAGSHIVEYGIGTGRVALPLSRAGFQITGIDVSPEMITRLRAKPGADAIRILEGSFTERHEVPGAAAVLCVFNTLLYVHDGEQQLEALKRAAEQLTPDGLLFLEFNAAHHLVRMFNQPSLYVTGMELDGVTVVGSKHWPLEQRLRTNRMVISEKGIQLNPLTVRYIWPAELRWMARLAGLRIVDELGDWSGAPFTVYSPEHRLILRLE